MKFFDFLDHTADISLRMYGKDLRELFQNAAAALFQCIGGSDDARVSQWVYLSVEGIDREDLLINWLRELLYLFNARELFLSRFNIEEITDTWVKAKVGGEPVDMERHRIGREIKAVTYHGVRVEKVLSPSEHWEADVVFDV